jgi:dihydroorotate dehydrogenase (NAD+) catalytic subunit
MSATGPSPSASSAPPSPSPRSSEIDLSVDVGPLRLTNPILSASGTFGYGPELERFFHPGVLGGIVGKSITLVPRDGNPPQRMAETAAGMINSIGLQNPGIDRFLSELLPIMRRYGPPVIVNVAGANVDEYVELCKRLDGVPGVAALELNLSCPNVREGGISFSAAPAACEGVVARCRSTTRLPLIAKLTPNVTDIASVARAAETGGADAISAINTLLAMAVDWRTRRAVISTRTGGLSGPAVKPIALRMVHDIVKAVKIPVIGIGGISSADDVLDFLCVGARAVQVGTATFADPFTIPKILAELPKLLAQAGLSRITELIGTLRA